jgi:replicative superfamily II helicase
MITWLKTEAKTHVFYLILIVMGIVAFRTWLSEHEQRVQAENTVKQSQQQVKDLQQQIVAVNAAAVQKVQVITKIVRDATTPSAVVQAVPELTEAPLNARVATDNPAQVSVDAQPLAQVLGQAREDAINLKACQDTSALKDQQLSQKDVQIKALKKKPAFWKRFKKTVELIGVCVGIGAALGVHI